MQEEDGTGSKEGVKQNKDRAIPAARATGPADPSPAVSAIGSVPIADWPAPLPYPLGDGHHCDVPLTAEDEALGAHLAYTMGTLYSDITEDVDGDAAACEAAYGHFFYRVSTSRNQWARIARALRIHGLKIVTAQAIETRSDETAKPVRSRRDESAVRRMRPLSPTEAPQDTPRKASHAD